MIKLSQAVIVEGRYDKITLENIIDATIITTDGFSIFKDEEKCNFIRTLAKKNGIIVMTDSDDAGAVIRSYLKKICADGNIINVYVPQLSGKEKRKRVSSKQGYLGVEGMKAEDILSALKRSGITGDESPKKSKSITKTDMYLLGLSGTDGAEQRRKNLAKYLRLPENFSSNAFLDAVNAVFSHDKFFEEVEKWQHEADKR